MPRYVTLEDNGPPEEFTAKTDEAAVKKMLKWARERSLAMEVFRSIGYTDALYGCGECAGCRQDQDCLEE